MDKQEVVFEVNGKILKLATISKDGLRTYNLLSSHPFLIDSIYIIQVYCDKSNNWNDIQGCIFLDAFQASASAEELLRKAEFKRFRKVVRVAKYFTNIETSNPETIKHFTDLASAKLEVKLSTNNNANIVPHIIKTAA